MTTRTLINEIKYGMPIEAKYNAKIAEWDIPKEPVSGVYDLDSLCDMGFTERGLTLRFSDLLPYSREQLEDIDKKLSGSVATKGQACPSCGNPVDEFGNDGYFCKFCGQKFKAERDIFLGENMKKLRQKAGLTLRDVEKAIGANISKLSQMENNKIYPPESLLDKLAVLYNCSVNELFGLPELRKDLVPVPVTGDEEEYHCPCCDNIVDLSIGESLSVDLPTYEETRLYSEGNDGAFCKYCGQALERPVEMDKETIFETYSFWINRAAKKRK